MTGDIEMVAGTPVLPRQHVAKPKVRTGCVTCKSRRVKCDETKPHCFRCIKFGHKCNGYLKNSDSAPKNQTKTPQLLPLEAPANFISLDRQPELQRFRSMDEFRYFESYCNNTARHLAGYYDPVLWNRIILQASEAEACVRHAVIAIGALEMTWLRTGKSKSKEQRQGASGATSKQMAASKERRVFALQQYSKAIRCLRETDNLATSDLRTTLVASILIICFETYHGNFELAGRQIYTAMQMLEIWTSKQAYTMSDPLKISSPAPDIIEDDLIHAFIRLDLQAMSNNEDQYSMTEHFRLKDAADAVVESLPKEFMNITEARNYFNIIARRVVHFGRLLEPAAPIPSAGQRPRLSHHDILAAHTSYVAEVEKWMSAFMPLFIRTRSPENQHFLAGTTLRLNYLAIYTKLVHFLDKDESLFDNEIVNYREMVNLAKILLEGDDSIFAFDLQIIWSMDIVAMKCRDPLLRREAIRLLISKPRREGVLDSLLTAKVHLWLVGIEEEGMRDGIVPEESRVRNFGMKLDLANRVANVSCEKPMAVNGITGLRRLQTTLTW
ncbi:hypothetical protein V494_01650 [Pseudogymnoascus sp. VKM F-4513 (FW-928)]|nr:hypothetical protein V494_01650 [Pseudogymnoascus sp. VKM F-4513 (FW-928)]